MDAVVLVSGGLDSAVALAIAQANGNTCHALTVDYGQRHRIELVSAARVCKAANVQSHTVVEVNLRAFGGSALTDNIPVPSVPAPGIPITYVPARNTIMLALALGRAETIGASRICIGVNAVDYSGYPDCRPEFISAFQSLANLATKLGVEGTSISIEAPLVSMTKSEIIQKGLELGVDFSLTHSCYNPDELGRVCGQCDSCRIRAEGFAKLGVQDPALVSV